MLVQMHIQYRNKKETKFLAQRDINSIEERGKFVEDVKRDFPIKEDDCNDMAYVLCKEGSPIFLMEAVDG